MSKPLPLFLNPKNYSFWRRLSQFFVLSALILIPILGLFRIDMSNATLVVLGRQVWVSEVGLTFVFWLMVVSAYYVIAMLYGRVFCGWGCPQNMWGEVADEFMFRIFGFGTIREKKSNLFTREPAKGLWRYVLFVGMILFLLVMGVLAWLIIGSYFIPFPRMLYNLAHPNLIIYWTIFIVTGLVSLFFFLGHWWCKIACPAGMVPFLVWNKKTMSLRFDENRTSECEKCNLCFASCTMQINVKDAAGDSKRFCINCGACADVCNDHLKPQGKKGLLSIVFGKGKTPYPLYIAMGAFLLSAGMFTYGLISHQDLDVSITAKNSLGRIYATNTAGLKEANYQVRVSNKDNVPHQLSLMVEGLPQGSYRLSGTQPLLMPGEKQHIQLTILLDEKLFKHHSTRGFTVKAVDLVAARLTAHDHGLLFIP